MNFWKDKKVLITGHEGFLGSWLTKTLLGYRANIIGLDIASHRPVSLLRNSRRNITGIKGNIVNLSLVKNVINRCKPQIIFHLAAEAIVGQANKNPIRTFKSNIEGTWNILEASRDKRFIRAIVIASSDKAYGAHRRLPYREDTPLKGNHPYDASKSCADILAAAYYNTYRLPVCVTRCGNIYGEGDFHFSRIVPDAIRCALKKRSLLIRSDGKFLRDYIYVKDIVDGYILLAEKMSKGKFYGEAFNFSNEDPIPVLELVKKIHFLANTKGKMKIKILNKARFEIKKQYLSSRKARTLLKWRPKVPIEEGLARTIDWYRGYFK